MQIIILCAGLGSRLGSITKDKPKCLVPINGNTILGRLLKQLEGLGIKKDLITLCGGYKSELLPKDYTIIQNSEYKETNMVFTLINSIKELKLENSLNDDLLIIYGDCMYETIIISKTIEKINSSQNNILPIDMNWELEWSKRFEDLFEDAETLIYNESSKKLISIGSKTRERKDYMGQFMGLLGIKEENINNILLTYSELSVEKQRTISTTEFLDFSASILNYEIIEMKHNWSEIDNKEDHKLAEKKFKV